MLERLDYKHSQPKCFFSESYYVDCFYEAHKLWTGKVILLHTICGARMLLEWHPCDPLNLNNGWWRIKCPSGGQVSSHLINGLTKPVQKVFYLMLKIRICFICKLDGLLKVLKWDKIVKLCFFRHFLNFFSLLFVIFFLKLELHYFFLLCCILIVWMYCFIWQPDRRVARIFVNEEAIFPASPLLPFCLFTVFADFPRKRSRRTRPHCGAASRCATTATAHCAASPWLVWESRCICLVSTHLRSDGRHDWRVAAFAAFAEAVCSSQCICRTWSWRIAAAGAPVCRSGSLKVRSSREGGEGVEN